jgi:hypothetical protein
MASVAFQLIKEVTAHAQSDSLENAREMCADDTYFRNNLRMCTTAVYAVRRWRKRHYLGHICIAARMIKDDNHIEPTTFRIVAQCLNQLLRRQGHKPTTACIHNKYRKITSD